MFNKTVSFLMIGICLILSLSVQAYAKESRTFRILVLNSYHKGFPWVDGIVKAVESGLKAENFNYDLQVAYMDTKAIKYNADFKKKLYEFYSFKYDNLKFDAIICSDDHAFDFLREYHKKLFPETPIVFCAVNNINAANLIDHNYFTGVLETMDQGAMINLALKLHPGIKKIYLIADTTPSGNYRWEKQTVPLISVYPNIEFIRIDDSLSLPEIENKMINLPNDAISFYAVLTRDKTGRYFPLKEAVSRISKASRRPIYTFLSQDLKYGLIGGNVLDGYHQGEKAVHMVIRILKGENIADIPVDEKPTSQFMFNYPQLIRYNINLSYLPEESYIINKPTSYYEQNKQEIWIVAGIFSFLVTVIVIFALTLMRIRKAEQERLESDEKLRRLFDHSPVGICTVDLLGNFVTTNPAYEQMLGYSKEELQDLSFFDVTHPDYRPENKALFQNMFSLESTGFKIEKNYIRKDGVQIDVSVHATAVIDDKGKTRFGTAFVEDITHRKQIEKELNTHRDHLEEMVKERTEALQKVNKAYLTANKELKEFAYIVSHDLKAPLRAISQLTHWISEDYSKSFDDEGKMQMELIIKRVRRMDGLIDGILRYSRVGRIREKKERLDLNSLVSEVIETIDPPKNIQVILENKLPVIFRDSIRMEQIFQNLIENAIKYMDKDEGIIKVGCESRETLWEFNVSDNGPGIDKKYHDKIFQIFQTLAPRDEHESTGIGLTLVKKIIELYGGSIWIESEPDLGTRFYFSLPKKGEKNEEF